MSIRIEPRFKSLIVDLLKRGRLRDANVEKYTQEHHMVAFRNGFQHRSYDPTNNYEVMEFLGDARIDNIIAQYVHTRFPQVRREGVLSKIKHKLKSGKQLGQFGHELGFFEFILFKPEPRKKGGAFTAFVKTHFRDVDETTVTSDMVREKIKATLSTTEKDEFLEEYEEYTTFVEDVFEAFIGTLTEVIDSEEPLGVSFAVAYNIVTSFLDTVPIQLTREWTTDPISRLKEMLYDVKAREGKGWNINKSIDYQYNPNSGIHTAIIHWYPKGDQMAISANRVKLASATARSKRQAGKKAAIEAITYLKTAHRYTELPLFIR